MLRPTTCTSHPLEHGLVRAQSLHPCLHGLLNPGSSLSKLHPNLPPQAAFTLSPAHVCHAASFAAYKELPLLGFKVYYMRVNNFLLC